MPGETILIVEDSAVTLKVTAAALRAEGYKVQVASTAEQALSSLRSWKPDLILVDIMLPGMDGLEFTRRIKQDNRLREVTVLALTACDMEGDEERARDAGCDGYLTKPVDKQTLTEVRQYLDFGGKAIVPPTRAVEPRPEWKPEAPPLPVTLAIPESEMEDLRRTFLADGALQSRELLASLDEKFDEKRAALLAHRWAGTGGLLGFPRISDRARELDVILRTPPWTTVRMRVALKNLAHAFAEPAAAVLELQIPDSIAHELDGKRVARAAVVNAFVRIEEEGLVLAVVEFTQPDRSAHRAAPAVVFERRPHAALLVVEKVVGPHGRPVERVKAGTVHRVGAGFDDHVGDAALRLAERRVESGGLDFELRHRIGGGHISRNDGGAGPGRGRAAVNGDIAQVAAGAAHGVIHNVGRLEGTVQPGIANERHARRQSGNEKRVAVGQRQRRDAHRIHRCPPKPSPCS